MNKPWRQIRQFSALTAFICLIGWNGEVLPSASLPDEPSVERLQVHLRQTIEREQRQARFTCRNELICGIADLPLFYARRGYRPAWVSQPSLEAAEALIRALRVADLDGLRTTDYHADQIETLLDTVKVNRLCAISNDPETLVDLDMLLTDAFLLLGSHLMAGRVNPETIHTEWTVTNPEANLVQILEAAFVSGQIESALDSLRPPHPGYRALKSALNRYRGIASFGGWPFHDGRLPWQKGESGEHISRLRDHLRSTGDLGPRAESDDSSALFDDALETGIKKFQSRHGLPVSGTLDAATLEELNVPVETRIRQIELNLERWRWIPHDLGSTHILVNVADFKLTVVETDRPKWSMRVVVGKDYRRTPVFSADLEYLVINPYWNIPRKIAVEDILPKIRRDPEYLVKKKIRVFENWNTNAREIDPRLVDWSKITKRNFAFKLRKDPGPLNDLGRIKFMLPNKYAVYLHDTPSRKLFARTTRLFSSGCIRLEKPIDLADYLLKGDPNWNHNSIRKAIESGAGNTVIPLRKPVPVHLLYWTAWVDHRGRLQFRDDVYGRDPLLDVALRERPPAIGLGVEKQTGSVPAGRPSA